MSCDLFYLQDVVKVADVLTRYLYHHGDKLLEDQTPIALSVNEMYSITRRLQLAQTTGTHSHSPAVSSSVYAPPPQMVLRWLLTPPTSTALCTSCSGSECLPLRRRPPSAALPLSSPPSAPSPPSRSATQLPTRNSSLEGPTKLKFAPFCCS